MKLAFISERTAIRSDQVQSVTINAVGKTKVLMESGYEYNVDWDLRRVVESINAALSEVTP